VRYTLEKANEVVTLSVSSDAVLACPRNSGRLGNVPAFINVLRPRLPSASELLPYLESIDQARWYSNDGPLVRCLEKELRRHFALSESGAVVATANCTLGLTAVLLARGVPAGSLCLMPSWTFAATPHAARAAGLTPFFHDVDPDTWALDPDMVRATLARTSARMGAILVVSPFGAPVDPKPWEELEDDTGVPVVLDAAAGFDTVQPSSIPSVVSLHATKVLGAGEGGFIITADSRLRERLAACCNFGFTFSREAVLPALNAKMSEYHAAVALASLAAWPENRLSHVGVAASYRRALVSTGISLQSGEDWASSTTNVVLPRAARGRIAERLLESGIETRAWWGDGCHVQAAFEDCPRLPLPVTEDLGRRVLGLPHFVDMREDQVDTVVDGLVEALRSDSIHRLCLSL